MGRHVFVWIGGGFIILLLLFGGFLLQEKYCWNCAPEDRFARGVELLGSVDADKRERGLHLVERAARQGVAEAVALVGELYGRPLPERYVSRFTALVDGFGSRPAADRQRAAGYFAALAELDGLSAAQEYNLAVLLETGVLEAPLLGKQAEDYYRGAAQRGDFRAMYELGMAEDRRRNYVEAARWFREAFSRGGHPGAALMLGDYEFYGRLGRADRVKALPWYEKALAGSRSLAGVSAVFAESARRRLTIAARFDEPTGMTVAYRLAGDPGEYQVFAAETDETLGRVVREGEVIEVWTEGGAKRQVSSMNEGLEWLLQSHAETRFGGDKRFRFVNVSK
jgi:TPR repeat protein